MRGLVNIAMVDTCAAPLGSELFRRGDLDLFVVVSSPETCGFGRSGGVGCCTNFLPLLRPSLIHFSGQNLMPRKLALACETFGSYDIPLATVVGTGAALPCATNALEIVSYVALSPWVIVADLDGGNLIRLRRHDLTRIWSITTRACGVHAPLVFGPAVIAGAEDFRLAVFVRGLVTVHAQEQ